MPTPSENARSGARALSMAALTASMLAGVMVRQRLADAEAQPVVFQRWMKRWAGLLLDLFGFDVTLASPLPTAANCARLVVSNHRSPIDILLLLRYFGGVVLSRADIERWPLLGLAAQRAETIFVDRQDTLSGILAIREIRQRLQQGRTVIVFPEGTTHRGDDVREFQGGAFAAARGLPVEVVPVGIAYEPGAEFVGETFMAHMTRVARRKRTRVACAFGRPRPLADDRKAEGRALRAEVEALVGAARSALEAGDGSRDSAVR